MNILHVLSQFEVTGAEVYAATLINEQIRHHHTVLVVSDTFSTPIQAPYMAMPIGKRSYAQRISNVRSMVRIIRTRRIDLIHAHSRAASWIAYVAALITHKALVSTVHGRQHIHTSSKSFSIYGREIIAVSESIKEHLTNDLGIRPEYVTIIPNGLNSRLWQISRQTRLPKRLFGVPPRTKVILFVGRLSGPKGDVARFVASEVLPLVMHECPCILFVIGAEIGGGGFKSFADSVNKVAGKTAVQILDFQNDLGPYLKKADVIIGSGRVATESLAMAKPTFAFGESHYIGRITPDNYYSAKASNFGDTGVYDTPDAASVANDLITTLHQKANKRGAEFVRALTKTQFDIAVVKPQVDLVYERAMLRQKSPVRIPVLMYHRIVASPALNSKHGIWVTTSNFEQQLRSLRQRGFTSITLRQYDEFRRGVGPLPAKPIILTFDDGYEDNYIFAFPLLQKYESKAVIFTTGDLKRRTNYWDVDEPRLPLLSVKQMREMANAGIEFGSHTVSHSKLTEIPILAALREIARSKEILEQTLSSIVTSFAYPYGAFHDQVKHLVAQSGYRYAVAGDEGPMSLWEDFFEIRRTQVFPWTTSFGFWKKTQPWYMGYKMRKKW